MTLADRDGSGAVTSRLLLVILLCAVALGIVGMHGLGSSPFSPVHVGPHALPAAVLTADHSADVDNTVGVESSRGTTAGDEAPLADDAESNTLCLTVPTPGLARVLWLLDAAALGGPWNLPPSVDRAAASVDVTPLPAPFRRQLTVLRI